MLIGLKIGNIAVIESAELEFDSGLNVMTGETGAGKSIVIDAINAVLGERTSRELIRSGAENARVYAEFTDISEETEKALDELGIEKMQDKTLVISRSLNNAGRNVCRANGCPVTVSALKELAAGLINIHGQHDSQALLSPEKHCGFIDSIAENDSLRKEYRSVFSRLISVKKELDALYDSRDEKAARLDYLNFQINEITDADIKIGEREELNKEKTLLSNSGKVIKALEKAYAKGGGISKKEWRSMQDQIAKEDSRRDAQYKWLKDMANNVLPFIILKEQLEELKSQIALEPKAQVDANVKSTIDTQETKSII